MLIEVEKDAFDRLQAELNSAVPSKKVLDKLGANPKTRARLLALMKEDNPELAIPEIDAAQPVLDRVEALNKRMDDEEKARAEAATKAKDEETARTAKGQIEAGRSWLRKQGYQDEGIEKVEKLMQDRGIPDYEAAALLFERTQPKDELIVPSNMGRSWGLFEPPAEDNDIRRALSMPKGPSQDRATKNWQWKEIDKTLKEIRGQGDRL